MALTKMLGVLAILSVITSLIWAWVNANMRPEYVLWVGSRSHTKLTDIPTLNRYDYTRHGSRLNLGGTGKFVQLNVNKIRCPLDSGKIPVLSSARSKPFLRSKPEHKLYTYCTLKSLQITTAKI
jgi:hypothetical protein